MCGGAGIKPLAVLCLLLYDARMKAALEPLFIPFSSGEIKLPADARVLFLNALASPALSHFTPVECTQFFKPYTIGLPFILEGEPQARTYDAALVLGTKSRLETEISLGKGVLSLKRGGTFVVAADNKEGAGRLKKMLQHLGFTEIAEASKNKSRVCWAVKPEGLDVRAAQKWADQDKEQEITGGFLSRPGIYGWDKMDKGSELLAAHLPKDLKGHGADFGCGYGYLSRSVLEKNPKIKALDCIDADARAVALSLKNIEGFDCNKSGLWLDLTASQPQLHNRYDWIVMNPPFHEGKRSDSDIGVTFIKNAHAALRPKFGTLYMVANNQLPYERVLSELFFKVELIAQGGGFKVFRAGK